MWRPATSRDVSRRDGSAARTRLLPRGRESGSGAQGGSIRSFGSDGEESRVNDTFAAGQTIVFDGTGFPGPRGLTVCGIRCDGRIPIQLDLITEVVLDIRDDGCTVRVVGLRAVDEP